MEHSSFNLWIFRSLRRIMRAVDIYSRRLAAEFMITSPQLLCLQTLHEFAGDPTSMRIILVNPDGERGDFTLAELFPRGFHKSQLTDRE